MSQPEQPGAGEPVLSAVHVSKHFPARGGRVQRGARLRRGGRVHRGGRRVVHAVDDVSISLYPGRITALVGESGSGKSTLARVLAQLYSQTSGEVRFRGQTIRATRSRGLRAHVNHVQLILQDPFSSFNPVLTIAGTLKRALRIHQPGARAQVRAAAVGALLEQVNLAPAAQFTGKYPHELSGGQLQRVSIARALAAGPDVILADEPVSSLDVSIRLGILNLLRRLTTERHAALLYVTHDIASARYFAEETAVMYAGQLIECGGSETVTQQAAHPYTQLLIASAPDPSRDQSGERIRDLGQPPSLIDPPAGCRFHPRCPFAMDRCGTAAPPELAVGPGHWVRCWLYAGDTEAAARREQNALAMSGSPARHSDGTEDPDRAP